MSDNRSVSTDALATLGTIIDASAGRDAIHLAVEPTKAQVKLFPGQDIGPDGTTNNPQGIVDPFLKAPVQPGEIFWLIIYPRTITSLRHVWAHPAFKEASTPVEAKDKAASEQWLRDFVSRNDIPSYEHMMETLAQSTSDPCFNNGGSAEIPKEFWAHYEIVSGEKVPETQRAEWFRCAC